MYGFKVIDKTPLPEFNAVGVWLKHEKLGMEVYHIQCDDEENLFSFAFKTPSFNSTGVAHILEHSVLCGSKNYPLKDPFLILSNQSVKTFLNAMTFPDKTVFPASTTVEKDYFNLMSVYGDAVFFPLLDEWTFKQEGHRLEYDKDGHLCIQGVVYNEMKGNYSSFDGIAGDWALRSLLQGSVYGEDSGGDPEHIPELTYEQFVQFHKKHYHPSNCRLFLYGNIELEKQLKFIDEHFLQYFLTLNGESVSTGCDDFTVGEPVHFDKPKTLIVKAPAGDAESGSTVLMNWQVGRGDDGLEMMELILLSDVLMGNDGSPLNVALLKSGLGEDVAPESGVDGEIKYPCFSVGLRGMKSEDAGKLEDVILSTLKNLCENGIPQQEIDAALLGAEFFNREVVRRAHGPHSLTLMRRALRGWIHGKRPDETLRASELLEVVKKRVLNDKNYLISLIKKFFLENNHRTTLIVEPDSSYNEKTKAVEQSLIEKLFEKTSEEQIRKEQDKLKELQQKNESEEKKALIPHLKPEDLKKNVDVISMDCEIFNDVKMYSHEDATNDITYLEVGFPVDVLEPADYRYLSFIADSITSIGFGGDDWITSASKTALTCGGLSSDLSMSSGVQWLSEAEYADMKKKNPEFDRSWLFFHIKMLDEKIDESVKLLFSCINTGDFTDKERIKNLLLESVNSEKSSIAPCGNQYAVMRAKCFQSRCKAVEEIISGISNLFSIIDFSEMDIDDLIKECIRIRDVIIKSGAVINITGTKSGIEKTKSALKPYVKELYVPKKAFDARDEDFYNLAQVADFGTENEHLTDVFTAPLQVGFAAAAIKGSTVYSKEEACETVFAHWLSNSLLWEQIRTIGGAYGANAYLDSCDFFTFMTYRDPKPEHSLEVFLKCLEKSTLSDFEEDVVQKAITGTYSKMIQPKSPSSKGVTGFLRKLYGITDEKRQKRFEYILSVSPKDMMETSVRLQKTYKERLNNNKHIPFQALILSKAINNAGKSVDLPL